MSFQMPKNQYVDRITVPEFRDENIAEVFYEITKKHPYMGTPKQFNTWLREYLLDHDVKVWQGPIYTIFYKEDPELYNLYLRFSKETYGDDPMPEKTFWEGYLLSCHDNIMENEEK